MSAGGPGPSLAQKLGLRPGQRAWFIDVPDNVRKEITAVSLVEPTPATDLDFVQLFVTSRERLSLLMPDARGRIASDGIIWACWPKTASGVATDLSDVVVREVALAHALVDVKVCAIDSIWSGLKLVIPRALRPA